MTSIRSASENKDDVLKYTAAYMRGLQDFGLIATLKHFPGDGYTMFDQHLTTSCNPLTKNSGMIVMDIYINNSFIMV